MALLGKREHVQCLSRQTHKSGKGLLCQWIDETEWKAVCSWLYGSRTEEKRKGVLRVAAWRARGTIPFPVESTVGIVECLIKEETERETDMTNETLCLMFSMAITRFINGMYDYGVWLGGSGAIFNVVRKFGIPYWLVDLRHDGTHRVLPFLPSLKRGVEFCYQWLWTNYWQPQYTSLPAAQLRGLPFEAGLRWELPAPPTNDTNQPVPDASTTSALADISVRKALKRYVDDPSCCKQREVYKPLANASVSDFTILLREKKFLCPMKAEDLELFNVPEKKKLLGLPSLIASLCNFWKPLLQRMGQYLSSAKNNLIAAIIIVMHSSSTDQQWVMILAGWLGALLSVSKPVGKNLTGYVDLTQREVMDGDVHWRKLIDVLKDNPGYFSYALMEICLNRLPSFVKSSKRTDVLQLTAMITISQRNGFYLLPPSLTLPISDETEYDSELKKLKDKVLLCGRSSNGASVTGLDIEMENENEDQNENGNGVCQWTRASGEKSFSKIWGIGDWYSVPLGYVAGDDKHLLTPVSLDLPTEVDNHSTAALQEESKQPSSALPTATQTQPSTSKLDCPTSHTSLILSPTEDELEDGSRVGKGAGLEGGTNNIGISPVQLQLIQQALTIY